MDIASLYDDDIVSWAEQQAAALRELAAKPELSNVVDWENLIEEVETLGRSEWGEPDPKCARPHPEGLLRSWFPFSRRMVDRNRQFPGPGARRLPALDA